MSNQQPPEHSRPLLIAIDGRSGSGKTSLAQKLATLIQRNPGQEKATPPSVTIFHLEDIYPGWEGLAAGVAHYTTAVVTPLTENRAAEWTPWDWENNCPGELQTTEPPEVMILEGVGAGAPRTVLDAVVYLTADDDVRQARALSRDGELYAPYWQMWAAQEEAFFTNHPVSKTADILVDTSAKIPAAQEIFSALASLPQLINAFGPGSPELPGLSAEPIAGPFDLEALFQALYGASEYAVWLDSSLKPFAGEPPQAAQRHRYSIMADTSGRGSQKAEHHQGRTVLQASNITTRISGPFFQWLETAWEAQYRRLDQAPHLPYALGWLGYLGYELSRETGGPDRASESPDAVLIYPSRALVFDHQEEVLWVLEQADATNSHSSSHGSWAAQIRQLLTTLHPLTTATQTTPQPASTVQLRDSGSSYRAKIRKAQAEILEGNSYEVCLTTAVTFGTEEDPWRLYRRLRAQNPAPFAAFMRLGALHILSTSPERLLKISASGQLTAEPIKGTRARDTDPQHDAVLKSQLETSSKDRAENVMIVDLIRHDLSSYAAPGSLRVSRLCAVESYATVHHLVSTIEAHLLPTAPRAQAVAQAFPAGSMTGAPKISTMQILSELEGVPRGPYSGAIGYFSCDGAAELSVVIRTLVLQYGQASLGLGGAITADSDPDAEWQEVRTKARGVLGALGVDFPEDPDFAATAD